MNHHLDLELVENNSQRWNLVSTNERQNNKRMRVLQPQPIPTIINRYAVLDKLQSELEVPHSQNWVNNATSMRKKKKYLLKTKKRKIVIIRDNHVRGCSKELSKHLGKI